MDARLEHLLRRHEGLRLKPYRDTRGKLTIGVGRNLDDRGITKWEALDMMLHDYQEARWHLEQWTWFLALNEPRQSVVISMCFNLGLKGFYKFKKMISALRAGDYWRAGLEMRDSLWARQLPERSKELARMMVLGEWLLEEVNIDAPETP